MESGFFGKYRKKIMTTLAEIRAKLLEKERKSEASPQQQDKSVFPHWDIPEESTTVVRFLPDGDQSNTLFWKEKLIIKIPFQGVRGEHNNPVEVHVPCMEMFGEADPILAEIKPWWNDDSLKDIARRYWKKKTYMFQGIVVDTDLDEGANKPESPIRRFVISSQIYEIIKSSLMNTDFDDIPTHPLHGRDFKIIKTKKGGQFANYGNSSWSFKERALSDFETNAIEQYGLYNLSDFLGKKPTAEEKQAIVEMFHASVNDEAYDPDRWGKFYKPKGSWNGGNKSTPSVAPATSKFTSAPKVATPKTSVVESTQTAPWDDDEPVSQPKTNNISASAALSGGRTDPAEIIRRLKESRGN